VEAIWKNRVSQKDKAHAAEARALRDEAAANKARADRLEAEQRTRTQGDLSEADRWKAQAEAANAALEQERQQRIAEVRVTKYPAAAEALDEAIILSMDEGKLAALNARLTSDGEPPAPSGPIDPNSAPKRPATPPSSPGDKSVEELQGDLKKYGPSYADRVVNG
jgi:hypothetical protein